MEKERDLQELTQVIDWAKLSLRYLPPLLRVKAEFSLTQPCVQTRPAELREWTGCSGNTRLSRWNHWDHFSFWSSCSVVVEIVRLDSCSCWAAAGQTWGGQRESIKHQGHLADLSWWGRSRLELVSSWVRVSARYPGSDTALGCLDRAVGSWGPAMHCITRAGTDSPKGLQWGPGPWAGHGESPGRADRASRAY